MDFTPWVILCFVIILGVGAICSVINLFLE